MPQHEILAFECLDDAQEFLCASRKVPLKRREEWKDPVAFPMIVTRSWGLEIPSHAWSLATYWQDDLHPTTRVGQVNQHKICTISFPGC